MSVTMKQCGTIASQINRHPQRAWAVYADSGRIAAFERNGRDDASAAWAASLFTDINAVGVYTAPVTAAQLHDDAVATVRQYA